MERFLVPLILALLACTPAARAEDQDFNAQSLTTHFGRNMSQGITSGSIVSAELDPHPPAKLIPPGKSATTRVYRTDLDGDGKKDYLVVDVPTFQVCAFTSAQVKKSCGGSWLFSDGFQYVFFFRPKQGERATYLIALAGDDDSGDFYVSRLDPVTWMPQRLFNFQGSTPVRKDGRDILVWSYAWDVSGLETDRTHSKARVAWPKNLETDCRPYLFFTGKPTQWVETLPRKQYEHAGYSSFAEIQARAEKLRRAHPGCEVSPEGE